MVGGIMASLPDNHKLFGGKEAALQWLQRFITLLPDEGNPLPLLTAPVLFSYLTATGHMLAHSFQAPFQSILTVITGSILPRLDESTIGQPSATRLKKILAGGINGFLSDLPPGALADLYNTSIGVSQKDSESNTQYQQNPQILSVSTVTNSMNQVQSNHVQNESVFNTTKSATIDSSMDMTHQGMTQAFPFGGSNQSVSQNSFATGIFSSTNSQASPFSGGGTTFTNQQSPFGHGSSQYSTNVSPFGVSQSTQVLGSQSLPFGGTDTTKRSPFTLGSVGFGGNTFASSGISPFGTATQAPSNAGIFGSAGSSQMSSNTSIFGSGSVNTGFGNTSTSNPSPFGMSKNITAMNSSGNNMGFGAFGNSSSQFSNRPPQTPFSTGTFGNAPSNTTGNNNSRPPCKFFQQGKCRNGDYCKFSHSLTQDNISRGSPSPFASPFGAPRR